MVGDCETCDYKKLNVDPSLHCYMFKEAPVTECMQHSDNKHMWTALPKGMKDLMVTAACSTVSDLAKRGR